MAAKGIAPHQEVKFNDWHVIEHFVLEEVLEKTEL